RWIRRHPLPSTAVLGLGSHVEFHSTCFVVEVSPEDADHVDMERIILRTSKVFVFGNAYNIVLAVKPNGPAVPEPEGDVISCGIQTASGANGLRSSRCDLSQYP